MSACSAENYNKLYLTGQSDSAVFLKWGSVERSQTVNMLPVRDVPELTQFGTNRV